MFAERERGELVGCVCSTELLMRVQARVDWCEQEAKSHCTLREEPVTHVTFQFTMTHRGGEGGATCREPRERLLLQGPVLPVMFLSVPTRRGGRKLVVHCRLHL